MCWKGSFLLWLKKKEIFWHENGGGCRHFTTMSHPESKSDLWQEWMCLHFWWIIQSRWDGFIFTSYFCCRETAKTWSNVEPATAKGKTVNFCWIITFASCSSVFFWPSIRSPRVRFNISGYNGLDCSSFESFSMMSLASHWLFVWLHCWVEYENWESELVWIHSPGPAPASSLV